MEVFRTGCTGAVGDIEVGTDTCDSPVSGKGECVASMLGQECEGMGSGIVAYGGGIDMPYEESTAIKDDGPKSNPLYSGIGGECWGEANAPTSTHGECGNSPSGAC